MAKEATFYSVSTVEPLKGFEQGDKMFGKMKLDSTVHCGDTANIQKMDPRSPSAPCEKICFVHFAIRWSTGSTI